MSHRVKVRELRKRLGHSQEEFAAHFPVAMQTISRWERGETSPSPLARARMREIERKHTSQAPVESSDAASGSETADMEEPVSAESSYDPTKAPSTVPRRRGIIPSSS